MVSIYLVLTILLIILIYNASTRNNEFGNTDSVIRQIWSGRCRSCPQDTYSGYRELNREIDSNQVGTSHHQGCVCESCPCALIDNWLKKCNPVTGILQQIAQLLYNLYGAVTDSYEDLTRVPECRATCQGQAKLCSDTHTSRTPSTQNFTLPDPDIDNVQGKKSSISFRISPDEPKKKNNQETSADTLKPKDSVTATHCSKCKTKSKTCISDCPKSKK